MPYTETKLKSGKYQVSGPSGVHAKGTTKEKADAQMRLLRGIEHGMVPLSKSQRRSIKGSPEFTDAEMCQGYRKMGPGMCGKMGNGMMSKK